MRLHQFWCYGQRVIVLRESAIRVQRASVEDFLASLDDALLSSFIEFWDGERIPRQGAGETIIRFDSSAYSSLPTDEHR